MKILLKKTKLLEIYLLKGTCHLLYRSRKKSPYLTWVQQLKKRYGKVVVIAHRISLAIQFETPFCYTFEQWGRIRRIDPVMFHDYPEIYLLKEGELVYAKGDILRAAFLSAMFGFSQEVPHGGLRRVVFDQMTYHFHTGKTYQLILGGSKGGISPLMMEAIEELAEMGFSDRLDQYVLKVTA